MAVTLDHSIHACLLSRAHRASLARVTKALSAPGAGLFMMCLLDAQVVIIVLLWKNHSIGKNNYLQCVLSSVTYISIIFCSFYRLLLVCELYFVDMRPALSHARKLRVLFLLIALSSFLIIVFEGSILMVSDHGKYYFCRGRAGTPNFK